MNALRLALEELHRADVLKRLVAGATTGNTDAFLGAAAQLTWSGGWADALRALVPLGTVPDTIRSAFQGAWQNSAVDNLGMKRTLTLDLLGEDHLLADGLAILLPAPSGSLPPVHYRAQSLRDYNAGRIGCWWTPDREFADALWLATSGAGEHVGHHVLLATEVPATAIIQGTVEDIEACLDPRQLTSIRMIGVCRDDYEPEQIAA